MVRAVDMVLSFSWPKPSPSGNTSEPVVVLHTRVPETMSHGELLRNDYLVGGGVIRVRPGTQIRFPTRWFFGFFKTRRFESGVERVGIRVRIGVSFGDGLQTTELPPPVAR